MAFGNSPRLGHRLFIFQTSESHSSAEHHTIAPGPYPYRLPRRTTTSITPEPSPSWITSDETTQVQGNTCKKPSQHSAPYALFPFPLPFPLPSPLCNNLLEETTYPTKTIKPALSPINTPQRRASALACTRINTPLSVPSHPLHAIIHGPAADGACAAVADGDGGLALGEGCCGGEGEQGWEE